ncbi:MAG: hypothetical protein H6970_05765 [Gammaproteobacteria bacterium]|nr:hypothetical protein [Gammaproteobacteria bacterium]
MTVTLHNQHPDSLSIEFWQVAYLALEHYLNGPLEPDGPQFGVEFELEASSGEEVCLRIWRSESGQVHIERLPSLGSGKSRENTFDWGMSLATTA